MMLSRLRAVAFSQVMKLIGHIISVAFDWDLREAERLALAWRPITSLLLGPSKMRI